MVYRKIDQETGLKDSNNRVSFFIEEEFIRHEKSGLAREKPQTDVDKLTKIFQESFDEVYGIKHSA
ncbi:MAG: hypothetical protein DHS20C01_10650 [marine bacterium B5-7]|nr:MAG: hypothetical protein DHS20C01_10650 [marine bacterium B5-7]